MAILPSIQRFDVRVTPIEAADGRWCVRIALADSSGNIVRESDIAALLFATSTEAERAGWSVAEGWLRRFREAHHRRR